jgi:hypothetical protein
MVLGGVSAFSTCAPTPHFQSNREVITAFTGRRFKVEQENPTYTIRATG